MNPLPSPRPRNMNQRIQKLAAHNGLLYTELYGSPYPRHIPAEESDTVYAEFADSILRECISILNKRKDHAVIVECIQEIEQKLMTTTNDTLEELMKRLKNEIQKDTESLTQKQRLLQETALQLLANQSQELEQQKQSIPENKNQLILQRLVQLYNEVPLEYCGHVLSAMEVIEKNSTQ